MLKDLSQLSHSQSDLSLEFGLVKSTVFAVSKTIIVFECTTNSALLLQRTVITTFILMTDPFQHKVLIVGFTDKVTQGVPTANISLICSTSVPLNRTIT